MIFTVKAMFAGFIFPLIVALSWQGEACRNSGVNTVPNEKKSSVQVGMWGGNHIRIQVTEGGATIDYDCAHGTIKGPLVVDGNGKFDFTGTHVNERGGPQREGEATDAHPARYTGSIDGGKMTLTVTLTDTKAAVGTFTLTHGKGARIVKCL